VKQNLPWGNVHSIRLAALTADGGLVPGLFPIDDDFSLEEVTLGPGQTLQGDYDLEQRWSSKAIPSKDLPHHQLVVFVWAYVVLAKELARPAPVCSGVAALKTAN
jgi:hypothetical protein